MAISKSALSSIKFNSAGLVPAIIQSAASKRVLMMAWMSSETLQESLRLGETVFWSRSRNERWHKGATSGNVQSIVSVEVDCDGDALLIHVNEAGAACHTGLASCFDSATIFISDDAERLTTPGSLVDEVAE